MTALRALCAVALIACSSARDESPGRIVVMVTIDWEGAYISADALTAVGELQRAIGNAPMTHFISAAYMTNGRDEQALRDAVARVVRRDDELAVHLHGWRSLLRASGVPDRASPSFLTGSEELTPFEHGDNGFDLDPDTHTVAELRAQLRTSRELLAKTNVPISNSFRAGGYLTTPKMVLALRSEGFTVDSSAIDARQLDELADTVLPKRLAELWTRTDAPFPIGPEGAQLLELPITAVGDYATMSEIVAAFDTALTRTQRGDTFVVLACHLETEESIHTLAEAIGSVRDRLADRLLFTTVESGAELVRLPPSR